MINSKYFCPRCGCKEIYLYGDTFDCTACIKEFEVADFEMFLKGELEQNEVLSIQEKLAFVKVMDIDTEDNGKLFD